MQGALRENRISINELLTEMRTQGIGDINDIRYGILEQNGKISLLKNDTADSLAKPLIIDAVLDEETMKLEGINEEWIDKKLKERGLTKDMVFLMSVNDEGEISVITKEEK